MTDAELRDQLMTLLLAGHETTATALAWTFDLLLRHPPVLAGLVRSVDAARRTTSAPSSPSRLRLRPVVGLAGRRLATELQVAASTLPAGTDVTPAIWLTHTRADLYPEPLAFRPERFLGQRPTTYAWVPFGGGVRRCLGAAFAEFEMRVVIETVLRRCALRPASPARRAGHPPQRHLSPRNGTRVPAPPVAHRSGGSPRESGPAQTGRATPAAMSQSDQAT